VLSTSRRRGAQKGFPVTDNGEIERDPRWKLTPTKIVVTLLLGAGIIAPLLVSTYDQVNPRLFGFPFFYWYQLLWVFIAAGLCGLSFFLLKRERDAYDRAHPTPKKGVDA
jgi:hypothetical protein